VDGEVIWRECVDNKGKFQGFGKIRVAGRVERIHLALIQQHLNFGETLYLSSISVALNGSNPGSNPGNTGQQRFCPIRKNFCF